ncbi:IgGFc-binding protein [Pygocentrus nattereri]|uniref:IgGFc-binding protein n=1 Tax=Pygocentrus nattereri TaxID=42514 RepID=UPI00189100E6|nr:IgGFc-binding protein [Pygocentrus nattereri]
MWVVCRNISCGLYELCAVVNGVRGCQPVGKAVCEAAGDPHYTSFDGLHFNFQGTCRYTLSQACGLQGTDLVPFSVEVENERWPYGAFKVSVTKQVSLAVFGHTFVLRQNMAQILVNGLLTNLPWSLNGSKVQISKEGINYVMTTDFGLRVTYNLLYYVTVTVPSTYRNKTCGLCGNFDGNPSNDFLLPNGNITTDKIAFGKAWKVAVSGVQCEDDCQGSQCPDCSPSLRAVFERPAYCGLLSDPLGPFAPCHAVVDPSAYLRDCVFDVCISGGSSTVACQSVAAYAFKCQTAGVALKSWRTDSFCPLSCPAHSHYELCADACSAACPGLTDIIKCSSNCTEGCTCDPGYMFNGHDCVQYLQCGCYEDGRTYELGEVVFQAQCQQKCMCDPVMGFLCETHTCSNGTHCMVRNGVEACFHTDPCVDARCREKEICRVTGDRAVCVPLYSTTCWAWGDPHYITFDGFNFDFQGTCRYTLSKTCGLLDGLEPFSVTESNDKRGNNLVSVVREVEVEVYGITVIIQKYQWGQIMVNGERLYLPLVLLGGRVRVKQVGSSAIMETDFGLRVSYNWNSLLYLQLPSSYYNRVCGLCGNYNGSRNDELRDPVGVPQATVAQWTSSWKSNKSEANCSDGCERDCPMFSADQQKLYNTDAYCGALTSTSLDVFTPCHAKVDPAVFQQSCVYDLYFNNGNPMLLCDALEAYVSRCRLEGIVITGWREKFNCPMRCQPHSHYEACASPCNSTCPSMQLQPNCTGVCVEACVCDPGFFLSGSTCLPADQCGCFYEGRYYQQGQSFWADEKCRRRCVCDSTLGVVVCREDSCSAKEICAVVDGVRMCVASSSATCEVFGDPHYRTFDGQLYDFQGSCMYQLVALCSNRTDLVPFNVTVQNEHRGSSAVSLTRTVMVSVFGVKIIMTREHPYQILFGGLLTDLPLEMRDMLVVYRSGITVVLETVFGLQVTFDWIGRLQVSLPSVYGGAVCGLCGNYNGSSQDDFTMPNGTIAPNDMALGQSWQVGSTPDCSSALCQNTQCFNCSGTQKEDAQRNCSIITDQTGPFKECHAMVDPRPYAANCVFDTCQYQGRQSVLCDSIAVYVSACQSKGVAVRPWRNGTFCSLSCPANSQYSLCAPGCVETCASLSSTCRRPCAEGCRCDPGFVFSGQTCVPLAECGCFYGGRYYKKRQVFYTDVQCQTRCECIENGAVVCQKSSCGLGEMCGVIDGVLGCHPNGYSSCLVTGDPHYTSFDGRMFDFQGVCVYTLAKVCTNAGEKLVYFSVETENESVGWASAVKAVTVSVYNFTIKIRQDESGEWRMRVNSEIINLPTALDGRILLTRLGFGVRLQTDFGLQVFYTTNHAEIKVPSTYNNSMCGLCGNYNGNPADDFLLPSGNQTTSVDAFGQAWMLAPPGVPCGGCEGICPKYEAAKAALYRGNDSCGLISLPAGPFSSCHKQVDPLAYVNNCLFDMFIMDGSLTALCQSIQAYASICQRAGLYIQAWRNSSFCPARCPANSHYSLCSDNCVNTCASLTWLGSRCPKACLEGCQCDEGFVWDGDACVPLKDCGCVHDGKYLKTGEVLVSKGCDVRCMCLPGGVLQCENQVCSRGEVCDVRDGRRGCHPELGRCEVYPNALLQSFDGAQGMVDQPGAFQMAFLCDDRSPEWFRVVADVRLYAKTAVASVANVYVFLQGTFITVNSQKHSWVNGKKVSYPSAPAKEVLIEYTGESVVIERASSVRVEYSNTQQLTLTISDGLAGKMCGACGNFNRNLTDDMVTASGRNSSMLPGVVASWQADDFSRCGL